MGNIEKTLQAMPILGVGIWKPGFIINSVAYTNACCIAHRFHKIGAQDSITLADTAVQRKMSGFMNVF